MDRNMSLSDDGTCSGIRGYRDVAEGASITVYDSNNKKVGLGSLDAGKIDDTEDVCVFNFAVNDVRSEDTIFSIEISHRGEISFKRSEADSIVISLGP